MMTFSSTKVLHPLFCNISSDSLYQTHLNDSSHSLLLLHDEFVHIIIDIELFDNVPLVILSLQCLSYLAQK